jgi:hypothetical protein
MSYLIFVPNHISEVTRKGRLKDKKVFSYTVLNKKKENLGQIIYDSQWKCWVWCYNDLRMSAGCLMEVVNVLSVHDMEKA